MIADQLVKIVHDGGVLTEPSVLKEYCADMSFVNSIMPECLVRPESAREVESIVKLANDTLVPIVPVSSGPPHFRGDTVPGISGAMVVDLRGMKKIMRVDRQHRYAMCEPGTTFAEMVPAVEKEGLRLNMPLLPRKSKSVVASLLEREPVTMPGYHWDTADPLNCLEVIFGTGDSFRTGSAAGPGTMEDQWKRGLAPNQAEGPSQASLHRLVQGAQGTMGIVTWASMRCELLPRLEEPFMVGSSRLDGILDFVHWLIRLRLVNECMVMNNSNLAAVMALEWPGDYYELKDALPQWVLFFVIAGYDYLPEERIAYQTKDMDDLARRLGMEPARAIGGIPAARLLKIVQRPSEEPYWKLRPKGACEDVFFLATYGRIPRLVAEMNDAAADAGYPSPELGIYLQPTVQGTNCHCEFTLRFDPQDVQDVRRARELSARAIQRLMAKGAFFSRPYGDAATAVFNRDPAHAAALRKVKAVLDPNNIMNPGKLCF
ncbi:MAG: FAD-binding oxidoreductase [Thermodesulfobacteriota bacterium]